MARWNMKKKVLSHGPLSSNHITHTRCIWPLYGMCGTLHHCSLHKLRTWGVMHGCCLNVQRLHTVNVVLCADGGVMGPGSNVCVGDPTLSSKHVPSGSLAVRRSRSQLG